MSTQPADPRSLSIAELKQLRAGSEHYRAYVGPPGQYDFMGATQFRLLAALGLREEHFLLDVGCGSLRAGRLLIQYLLPERYHGIEPNGWLVEESIDREIGHDAIRIRRPRFSDNAEFDYSVFGRAFDYIVAQSILSHTGHDLAAKAIFSLPKVMHDNSLALFTFLEASPRQREAPRNGWSYPDCVYYDPSTISKLVEAAGLVCQRLPWFHPRQTWYLAAKQAEMLLAPEEIVALGSGRSLRDGRFK